MNILVLSDSFPPEIRSASHLMHELCEALTKKGHNIAVITTFPKYNIEELPVRYRKKLFLKEFDNGITVYRVPSPPIHFAPHVIRAISQWILAVIFIVAGLIPKRTQAILVYSPPLTLGISAHIISKLKRASFVFNVQDLFPKFAIEMEAMKNKLVIGFYNRVERYIFKKARKITVHSKGNREYIENLKIPKDKIEIVYNWVDLDYMKPAVKYNQFRAFHGLDNNFIVSFAGVIGLAQDLKTVVDAAHLLKEKDEIKFVIVGDGLDKKQTLQHAHSLKLKNILFLPFQSKDIYPQIIAASDLCLVTLKKSMRTPVVPGKLFNIMAGERPVILSVPDVSDAIPIVEEAGCGIRVKPEDPAEMAEAIMTLYEDRSLAAEMGKRGREYAARYFSLEKSLDQYERLFLNL